MSVNLVTGRKAGPPTIQHVDPIFSHAEMARYLRVSEATLHRYRKRGLIGYIQLTARTLGYRQSHGDALLAARTVEAR
jgi:hypothetical protein